MSSMSTTRRTARLYSVRLASSDARGSCQNRLGSAEYRAMAEECFKWAREAHSAELRVSLLLLAQVWLDIASKVDGLPPDLAVIEFQQSGFGFCCVAANSADELQVPAVSGALALPSCGVAISENHAP
jgi:hypothetical protein